MMTGIRSVLPLLLVAAGGLGIGFFHFGGLWLTVRRLPAVRRPALLVFGSLIGRIVVSALGVFLLMRGQLPRLLACLAGIVVARLVLVRRLRSEPPAG
jgi:F1F0 ATPase subunit 2